jgi:hypothetical protein
MIRQLTQCPYCQGCEVALSESLDIVLNPDGAAPQACPHLIHIEGRYSQFALSPLPGRKTKIARMIGSNEFEWLHPEVSVREDATQIRTYLKEMAGAGGGWSFAPAEEHSLRFMSVDHKITDAGGKEYPEWEIEGSALFARDAQAFLQSLPACVQRQNATWTDFSDLSSN